MPINHIVEVAYAKLKRKARQFALPLMLAGGWAGAPAPAAAEEQQLMSGASIESALEYRDGRLAKATAQQIISQDSVVYFFVDSAAVAGGNGSKTSPFQTINDALAAASSSSRPRKRIIVEPGAGGYPENVALLSNTEIYGRSNENTIIEGTITATGTTGWILKSFLLRSPTIDANFGVNAAASSSGLLENIKLDGFLANYLVRGGSQVDIVNSSSFTYSSGGDVKAQDTGTIVTVTGCTFAGDTLGTASSLVAQGGAIIISDSNVILDHGAYAVAASSGGQAITGYNLLHRNVAGSHFGASPAATDLIGVDPMLKPGVIFGKIDTYRPENNSPVVNSGNPDKKNPDDKRRHRGYFHEDSTYFGGARMKGTAVDTIEIPINLKTDILEKGSDAIAVELVLEYDPLKFTPVGIRTDSTLVQGMMLMDHNLDDVPYIRFVAASLSPMAGRGPLIRVLMEPQTAFRTNDTLKTRALYFNERGLVAKLSALTKTAVVADSIPPVSEQMTIITSTPNYGDADQNAFINPLDVSAILRHNVRKQQLTPEGIAAADVSGVAGVSSFDAALILRHQAGLITQYPVDVEGEGSGPKQAAGAGPLLRTRTEENGKFIEYIISGEHMETALAFDFRLTHDPLLRLQEVISDAAWQVEAYSRGGKTAIAMAGRNPFAGSEVRVRYAKGGEHANITLEAAMANETEMAVRQESPREYTLSQNFPNPSNPATTIRYELPKAAKVRLEIYNAIGQRIRTLISTHQDEGRYMATWDGTNNQGAKVASGVYIYRLEAGEFTMAKKMTLLK